MHTITLFFSNVWNVIQTHRRLVTSYIKFTDRTVFPATGYVIPFVRKTASQMHARFSDSAVRLSLTPVGVIHYRHCITVRVRWRQSPHECGPSSRVYTLSSRPERHSPAAVLIAITLYCLWKYPMFNECTNWILHSTQQLINLI